MKGGGAGAARVRGRGVGVRPGWRHRAGVARRGYHAYPIAPARQARGTPGRAAAHSRGARVGAWARGRVGGRRRRVASTIYACAARRGLRQVERLRDQLVRGARAPGVERVRGDHDLVGACAPPRR